jgi:hypothetical protein
MCLQKAGHTELFSKIASIEAKEWSAYQVHMHVFFRITCSTYVNYTYIHIYTGVDIIGWLLPQTESDGLLESTGKISG